MKLFCLQCAGGQLREIATGDAYRYDVYQGDKERNEQRYEEIAKVVIYMCVPYVYYFTFRPIFTLVG